METKLDSFYNLYCLEGSIGGVKKVIYLVPDEHVLIENREGCSDGQGTDVKDYLVKQLLETEHPIDFFMEISREDIDSLTPDPGVSCENGDCRQTFRASAYITKMRRVFKSLLEKPHSSIRLHPFGISSQLTTERHIETRQLYDLFNRSNRPSDYEYLRWFVNSGRVAESLETELSFQSIMLGALTGEKLVIPKQENGENAESDEGFSSEELRSILTLIDKICNQYIHPDLKKALESWIEKAVRYLKMAYDACTNLKAFLEEIRLACDKVGTELFLDRDSRNGYVTEVPQIIVANLCVKIHEHLEVMYYCGRELYPSLMMEIYVLRRLLDQDEIKHALIYTGDYHSLSLLAILIKTFDFRITHLAHSNLDRNLDDLNDILREASPGDYVPILKPAAIFQRNCVNVTSIPRF